MSTLFRTHYPRVWATVLPPPFARPPQPVYQLQKKLLQLRMMRAVNHPDFRSSDIRKARKMIARLKTAQRFEELRAEGIDPYKQYPLFRVEHDVKKTSEAF